MLNALTIDVEDYFMVSAFEPLVPKSRWGSLEGRVAPNTRRILGLLEEAGARATFFVLGWVAERHPDLVREIRERGHEVACHGHLHRLIYSQSPEDFRQDVRRAKRVLEAASGVRVDGYRAPSFSVVESTRWALDVLRQEGFLYDASVLPAAHARGGLARAHRFPHRLAGLWEFPMSTLRLFGRNFSFAGGGYFRLLPYPVVRWGLRRCNAAGQPGIVYLHPWEIDPGQPRLKGRRLDMFRHYVNLDKTEAKLRRLLKEFRFGTAREVLERCGGFTAPAGAPRGTGAPAADLLPREALP